MRRLPDAPPLPPRDAWRALNVAPRDEPREPGRAEEPHGESATAEPPLVDCEFGRPHAPSEPEASGTSVSMKGMAEIAGAPASLAAGASSRSHGGGGNVGGGECSGVGGSASSTALGGAA